MSDQVLEVTKVDSDFTEEFRSFKRFIVGFGFIALLILLFTFAGPLLHVLVMLYAGILFAVLLNGLAEMVRKQIGISYRVGLVGVLLILLLVSGLGGLFMGNQVAREITVIQEKMPQAQEDLRDLLENTGWGKSLLSLTEETEKLWSLGSGVVGDLTGFFSETAGVFVSVAFVLVAGIYISMNPEMYIGGLLRLFPPSMREEVQDTLTAIGVALRKWLIGRLVAMATVGVLTTVGLLVVGIPSPIALGLLAGLMAFVPFIGPLIAVVPAILVALIEDLLLLIPVAIIFVVVHSIGGYLVTPLVQKRAVSLSPVLLLTSQVIIGLLLGIPGIIIATPLTITIIVSIQKGYIEGYLGDSVEVLGQGS